ncbi:hypothetical protein [Streptomyces sp. NPDC046985]|uniref:hypothetical protein n=1 Tax=Streptomyces sp. NPDC046985 TaxID=3155377 RepID=UPI0033DC442A
MSITEQYFLDMLRARQRGEPSPPLPGRHDLQVLRELRASREPRGRRFRFRFRTARAARPARGRLGRLLGERLRGSARSAC